MPRPAIILGGDENALSVARNLSAAGVPVYKINKPHVPARWSRYGTWLGEAGGTPVEWARFLLGDRSDRLAGAVILACGDDAIELIAENHAALAGKFLLEECPPAVRLRLLDKLSTYECARAADVPVPGFWCPGSASELRRVAEECRFPVLLKPRLSYHSAKLGRKHIRADDRAALEAEHARLVELGIPAVVMELIPGGDDLLCSYYTYVDGDGTSLIEFTKRVTRRYPMNQGRATYHETTWNPEVAALGAKFFRHAGLRGLGNVEFKLDRRDGRLKIIESNARFTAADALVTRSGIDFASFAYARLTGAAPVAPKGYQTGLVLWYPLEDFLAFLQVHRLGMLSWRDWLRAAARTDLFPYFRIDDPVPGLVNLAQRTRTLPRLWSRMQSEALSAGPGGSDGGYRGALSRSHGPGAG
jgi:predicted ATP-grasp superfamily ATP-dependent carboligase